MSKRKIEPLEGGDLPPEKKQKTKESKDDITVRYEPEALDQSKWQRFTASYYTLRRHCKNPFFDSPEVPDEDLVIKTYLEYGSVGDFLKIALDCPFGETSFVVEPEDGECVPFPPDDDNKKVDPKQVAIAALGAVQVAGWFGHEILMNRLIKQVVRAAKSEYVFEDRSLWNNGPACMEALLDLEQKLGGKQQANLLVALDDAAEATKYVLNPAMSERFAKVFRHLQLVDWRDVPEIVKRTWECPRCHLLVQIWSHEQFAEEIVAAKSPIDWDARRNEKIAAIKTCRDH